MIKAWRNNTLNDKANATPLNNFLISCFTCIFLQTKRHRWTAAAGAAAAAAAPARQRRLR
jgi:hypothetical protein